MSRKEKTQQSLERTHLGGQGKESKKTSSLLVPQMGTMTDNTSLDGRYTGLQEIHEDKNHTTLLQDKPPAVEDRVDAPGILESIKEQVQSVDKKDNWTNLRSQHTKVAPS